MAQPTHYEILRVRPTAMTTDINNAYKRITKEMESEHAVPDARLAARVKLAYEVLSDPETRAAYNETLRAAAEKRPQKRGVAVAAGVVVLAVAGFGAWKYMGRAKEAAPVPPLAPEQILAIGDKIALPMEETRISGEVAQAGVAVATGTNEAVTPCHTLIAGAQIMIGTAARASRADMARADAERDICVLRLKDSNETFAKVRPGDLPPGEKVFTVVHMGAKPSELREGHVVRPIPDAKGGTAYEIILPGTVPNGSPLLDVHGELAGIVTSPHDFGAGLTVALGASRINKTVRAERTAAEAGENAIAAMPKTSHGSTDDFAPSASGDSAPRSAAGRKPQNLGEAYRNLNKQRRDSVDEALVKQVNGPTPR